VPCQIGLIRFLAITVFMLRRSAFVKSVRATPFRPILAVRGVCVEAEWEVVVYYVCCVCEVESAACEVGGDHYLDFHSAEAVEE